MPSFRKLAQGLATAGQGFAQMGNAAEFKLKYDQAVNEQALKEQEMKLHKFKLEQVEKEVATTRLGQAVGEYARFAKENPKSAETYFKMPEVQAMLQEVAPKMGMSIDRAALTLKDKAEFFRVRRDNQASTLDAFGNQLMGDAPQIAKSLKEFAPLVKNAKDETELTELWKDGKDLLTQAMSYSRMKNYNDGAVSRTQVLKDFDVTTDGSGTNVKVKGGGTVNVVPKNKTTISTNEAEDIRAGVAGFLGVDKETLKDLTRENNKRHGYKLDDIDMLSEEAQKKLLDGAGKVTPQEAINQVKQSYQEESKTIDGALQKLLKEKDPTIQKAMTNAFGRVLDFKRVPLKKKKEFLANPDSFLPQQE